MAKKKDEAAAKEAAEQQGASFQIERLYVKDVSFESPRAPAVFQGEWKPESELDLHTKTAALGNNFFEVELGATVKVKNGEEVAFLVEVKQAGIFTIVCEDDETRSRLLGSFAPSIVFPYLRELICDVVVRGGFPPLYIAPVNFDQLYIEHMKKAAAEKKTEKS